MQNMSYCRFENTVGALTECYDALKEDGVKKIQEEASHREAPHVIDLLQLCREIVEAYDDGELDEDI
jgi:hypothetical protein